MISNCASILYKVIVPKPFQPLCAQIYINQNGVGIFINTILLFLIYNTIKTVCKALIRRFGFL